MSKVTRGMFSEVDRFGERGKPISVGKDDTAVQARVNVEILRPTPLTGEATEAQRLVDEMATRYFIVKARDSFPIFNGALAKDLDEAAVKALDGTTLVIDPAALAPGYFSAKAERKATSGAGDGYGGNTEKVCNEAARLIAVAKQKAGKPNTFADGVEVTGREIYNRLNAKGENNKITNAAKDFRKAMQKIMKEAEFNVIGKAGKAETADL